MRRRFETEPQAAPGPAIQVQPGAAVQAAAGPATAGLLRPALRLALAAGYDLDALTAAGRALESRAAARGTGVAEFAGLRPAAGAER